MSHHDRLVGLQRLCDYEYGVGATDLGAGIDGLGLHGGG